LNLIKKDLAVGNFQRICVCVGVSVCVFVATPTMLLSNGLLCLDLAP